MSRKNVYDLNEKDIIFGSFDECCKQEDTIFLEIMIFYASAIRE